MCRLVAYLGHTLLVEDVVVKPINSLVRQSLHALETDWPTNGDGFGLGWYTPEIDEFPALFTSIQPAWNDRNLLHLSAKIKSSCFAAHVRAASAGGVTQYNCHPFVSNQWLFLHNGGIHDFIKVKRHLRHLLDDDIYHWIKGETDSEHAFGLFLQLAKGIDLSALDAVADIFRQTIETINRLVKDYTEGGPSTLNLVLTDGVRMLVCRYHSTSADSARSLHYAQGQEMIKKEGHYHMIPAEGANGFVLIASEKLTAFNCEWLTVPANHLMLIDKDKSIRWQALD